VGNTKGVILAISGNKIIAATFPATGTLAGNTGISVVGANTWPGKNATTANIAATTVVFAGTLSMVNI
jgi:hypothetical protein